MDKRTKGWLALRGLWGKRKRSSPKARSTKTEKEEETGQETKHIEENNKGREVLESFHVQARSIPKISEAELSDIIEKWAIVHIWHVLIKPNTKVSGTFFVLAWVPFMQIAHSPSVKNAVNDIFGAISHETA